MCPLSAPRSARRHSGEFAAFAGTTGAVKVLTATDSGSGSRGSADGGGGTTGAIRSQSDSRAPIWKSAPSGRAISAATNCLNDVLVIRRITSPARCPWLLAW